MRLLKSKRHKDPVGIQGDTIVEVLIAIAIASFAIGISYATAQRSLDQAISAREHNEALNILENQVTDLRVRFQAYANNLSTFNGTFANKHDFCLDDSSKKIGDPGWTPYMNYNGVNTADTDTSKLSSSTTPTTTHPYYYASSSGPQYGCQTQRTGDGAVYYVNIDTSNPNATGVNSTLYYITVRWPRIGGGVSRASLYYKLNYDPVIARGVVGGGGSPPPDCNIQPLPQTISESDTAQLYRLENSNGYREMTVNLSSNPWQPVSGCSYIITVSTHGRSTDYTDANQRMSIDFCADITPAFTSTQTLENCSSAPLYSTSLTPDIDSSLTATYTAQFSLSAPAKYILLKHCSLSIAACQTQVNKIDGYDISITHA